FLAMTYQRLGKTAEARNILKRVPASRVKDSKKMLEENDNDNNEVAGPLSFSRDMEVALRRRESRRFMFRSSTPVLSWDKQVILEVVRQEAETLVNKARH